MIYCLFLLCSSNTDIDSNTALSHALAASQGFGAVPVGFSAGCPVATLRPCLLPSSAPSDDGDGLSGITHPDNAVVAHDMIDTVRNVAAETV